MWILLLEHLSYCQNNFFLFLDLLNFWQKYDKNAEIETCRKSFYILLVALNIYTLIGRLNDDTKLLKGFEITPASYRRFKMNG